MSNNNAMPGSPYARRMNGEIISDDMNTENNYNKSGMGSEYDVPDIVSKKFNWGAFFLTWIWGIGNKTYITFLIFTSALFCIIPFIGGLAELGFKIWFGIKGNEWAWQNKRFESIEAFHKNQRNWVKAGIICYILLILTGLAIFMLVLPALMTNTSTLQTALYAKKAANTLETTVMLNEAMQEKCELSSEGLAECFVKRMNGNKTDNIVETMDGILYTFESNGICENKDDCKITFKIKSKGKSKTFEIPLYADSEGNINLDKEELEKIKNDGN